MVKDTLTYERREAGPALPRVVAGVQARDPQMEQLLNEMRGLMFLLPVGRVSPEADEAMFDNMPV